MNALRLDPAERTFAQFYEPRSGPRFSRKTVLAVGITALCYGAVGYYFMNQKYEIVPFEQPAEPPAISVQTWLKPEPPKTPVEKEQAPVRARPVDSPILTDVAPLPIAPSNEASNDVMPTTPDTTTQVVVGPAEPAAPSIAPPGVIRNPVWISRPTPEQVARLYPAREMERGVTGRATLLCGIRASGAMTDCQVVELSPEGAQFGKAALAMARYFKISPKTIDGRAVEGFKVRIPIVFSLAE